jgi:hypothetical protein
VIGCRVNGIPFHALTKAAWRVSFSVMYVVSFHNVDVSPYLRVAREFMYDIPLCRTSEIL